jgi:hypothetical protein
MSGYAPFAIEIIQQYQTLHVRVFGYFYIYTCLKSLEPMGILIMFLTFIYRLKLKVTRLKMALALDERVEIVLHSGRQGWCMLLKSEIFVTLGRELQTVVLLSIPIC